MPTASRNRRRAGFTLVELLAVMAILSLLVGLALTIVPKALARSHSTACKLQLRDIAANMQLYVDDQCRGVWPKERGVKFLLKMVKDGYIKGDALNKFRCPATNDTTSKAGDDKIGSGLTDWDDIDTECISYAGRDNVQFPLNKNRLDEEVIASDDNWSAGVGRPNHDGYVNVVYASTRVDQIMNSTYKGQLPENQDWLPVGPESPDENLRKLSVE